MPAKTKRQARFMQMCANNPSEATKPCPPKAVAQEFKEFRPETRKAASEQKQRGEVLYH